MQRGISSDSKRVLIIALCLLQGRKLAIEPIQTAQVSDVFFPPVSPEIKGEPGVRNTTVC